MWKEKNGTGQEKEIEFRKMKNPFVHNFFFPFTALNLKNICNSVHHSISLQQFELCTVLHGSRTYTIVDCIEMSKHNLRFCSGILCI